MNSEIQFTEVFRSNNMKFSVKFCSVVSPKNARNISVRCLAIKMQVNSVKVIKSDWPVSAKTNEKTST